MPTPHTQPDHIRPCVLVHVQVMADSRARAWLDHHGCDLSPQGHQRLEVTFPDSATHMLFVLCWSQHIQACL